MPKKKSAIIIGITGQDGSYLAEFLLKKNYKIYAFIQNKKNKKNRFWRLNKIFKQIFFYIVSLNKYNELSLLIKKIKPNEIYHLGSRGLDYKLTNNFFKTNPNIIGTKNILSIIKKQTPKTKFYFASSSEIFGKVKTSSQNENTKLNPKSPYAISKVEGFKLIKKFRKLHNLYACMGILYNHESPRRGEYFVTKKIAKGVAKIHLGFEKKIKLGNIKSKRDWGHAQDYVKSMWKMLQLKKPTDFVIGTGKQHSVEDFLKIAFKVVNLNYKKYIEIDKSLVRKNEINRLIANNMKAKKILKWKPQITFKKLVTEMVNNEINLLKKVIN
jgi:GDPmannose 4,6-dehydratase